jgi:hypothetical protein
VLLLLLLTQLFSAINTRQTAVLLSVTNVTHQSALNGWYDVDYDLPICRHLRFGRSMVPG